MSTDITIYETVYNIEVQEDVTNISVLDETIDIVVDQTTEQKVIVIDNLQGPQGPEGIQGPTGPQGPQGIQGATGAGVPTGGTTGQVLSKNSATNYDTSWVNPPATGVTSVATGTGLTGGPITSTGTIAIDSTVATLSGSQTLTNKTISGSSNTLTNIDNGSLTNSSITINGTPVSLGGSTTVTASVGAGSITTTEIADNTITGTDINTATTVRVAGLGVGVTAPASGISVASGTKVITRSSTTTAGLQLVSNGSGDPTTLTGGDFFAIGAATQSLRFYTGSGGTRTIAYADYSNLIGQVMTNVITTVIPLRIRGAASQTANLQEWQNSAGTVLGRVDSSGFIYGSQLRTLNSLGLFGEANSGGFFTIYKANAAINNPGADYGRIYFRDGTTAGTLKLVVRAGAAGAETTILDNIPQ